ncbi:hypothetical protein QE449_002643 [Rhodococcus sp. SORGH_AS303]|nr:hypothetical protein [Rhodococcus sp. SORGH_AS_0303]
MMPVSSVVLLSAGNPGAESVVDAVPGSRIASTTTSTVTTARIGIA